MKKNKLLAPLLGLSAVATAIVPVATSCTSETSESDVHVKTTSVTEKEAGNGVAQFLLELDRDDYIKENFTITVSMSEKDKSGALASDFTVSSFLVDGNHMAVTVKYINEEDPLEDDTQVRIMLNVKYGSQWTNSVEVKFDYVSAKGGEGAWDTTLNCLATGLTTFTQGTSVTITIKLNKATTIPSPCEFWSVDENKKTSVLTYESIKIKLNGTYLTVDKDYVLAGSSGKIPGGMIMTKLSLTDTLEFELTNITSTCKVQFTFGYDRNSKK